MKSFFTNDEIDGTGIRTFMSRTGGKSKLKKIIVDDEFPLNYKELIYVEPFVGAGHVYFYKEPSVKEIINDYDKDVVDIFKGMKKYDGTQISEDIKGIYSKKMYNDIINAKPKNPYDKFIQLLLRYKLSFFGQGRTYGSGSRPNVNPNYGSKYNDRLKHTLILNKDYKYLINKYDSPQTLFYLDPPYEINTKSMYTYDDVPIKDVYDAVKNIKGLFILSYNDSKEAKELFKDYTIKKVKTKYSTGLIGNQTRDITELIIKNF
jgi:DNA adenine methylase